MNQIGMKQAAWIAAIQAGGASTAPGLPLFHATAAADFQDALRQAISTAPALLILAGEPALQLRLEPEPTPESIALLCLDDAMPVLEECGLLLRLGDDWPQLEAPAPRSICWCVEDRAKDASPLEAFRDLLLALHDRELPVRRSDARYPLPRHSAQEQPLPWIHGGEQPRRAALCWRMNGLAQVLHLEEANGTIERAPLRRSWRSELVVLSAPDRDGLLKQLGALKATAGGTLEEIATRSAAQASGKARLAIVAASRAELDTRLAQAEKLLKTSDKPRISHPAGIYFAHADEKAKVALLYPGQGMQYAGMLRDAIRCLPGLRGWFDLLDAAYPPHLPFLPSRLLFQPHDDGSAEQKALHALSGGGLAALIAALACTDFLHGLGLKPAAMLGHSNGENAALVASGVLRTSTRKGVFSTLAYMSVLFSSSDRSGERIAGQCFALALPQGMTEQDFAALLGPDVHVTMDNCPQQKVIWGRGAVLEAALQRLRDAGVICLPLPISQPYHTSLFAPIAEQFLGDYGLLDLGPGRVPLYSGLTARPFPETVPEIVRVASGQWSAPVRFGDAIARMHEDGLRVFIDAGPGGRLAGFVRDTLRDRDHIALALDQDSRPDISTPLRSVAQLFVLGAIDSIAALYPAAASALPPVEQAMPQTSAMQSVQASPVQANPVQAQLVQQHMRLMQEFLQRETRLFAAVAAKLQQESVQQAPAQETAAPPAINAPVNIDALAQYGLLGIERQKDAWEARLRLTPEQQSFLYDHVFGWRRSRHGSEETGLAVLPLFMSLEIAAAAASRVAAESGGAGLVVRRIEQVRGHRWLAADAGAIDIQLRVSPLPAKARQERRFAVSLSEGEPGAALLAFDCVVDLGPGYLPAPAPLALPAAAPPPAAMLSAAEFRKKLFHGPAFSSLERMLSIAPDGIALSLGVPPQENLFSQQPQPRLCVPGPLLDSAGQILALHEKATTGRVFGLFPYGIDALSFHAAPAAGGTAMGCVARHSHVPGGMIGRLDYLDAAGRVAVRIEGLRGHFFDWSRRWERLFFPGQKPEPLADLLHAEPGMAACIVRDFEPGFLEASHKIWLRVLAAVSLRPREAESFRALPGIGTRQRDWLLGRLAAKEAGVALLGAEYDVADLEVAGDETGGTRLLQGDSMSPCSISHCTGFAAAVAAEPGWRVGIDIEPRAAGATRLLDSGLAFTAIEADALSRHGQALLWCAKEAAAKAIGTGLMGAPTRFEVCPEQSAPDLLQLNVAGETVTVRLLEHADCYAALCRIDAASAERLAQKLAAAIAA